MVSNYKRGIEIINLLKPSFYIKGPDNIGKTTPEEINESISTYLRNQGVVIDNWQYCPDVDHAFVNKHPEIKFNPKYAKQKTNRKPAANMLLNGLKELKLNLHQFATSVILGDRDEDAELAKVVKGKYLDVKGKNYQELLEKFKQLIS